MHLPYKKQKLMFQNHIGQAKEISKVLQKEALSTGNKQSLAEWSYMLQLLTELEGAFAYVN